MTSSQTLHEVLHEVNTDPDKFTVPKNAPSEPLLSTQHPISYPERCLCAGGGGVGSGEIEFFLCCDWFNVHADKTGTPKFRGTGCQFLRSQCHPSPRTGVALGTRLHNTQMYISPTAHVLTRNLYS